MNLNTLITLPDGRIGTISWRHLDGEGGVWGEHEFEMPDNGFGDDLPKPEFMLRKKSVESLLREMHGNPSLECVGEDFEIIERANNPMQATFLRSASESA